MVYVQHERPENHQCALCGSTTDLKLHHIFPARAFAARATKNNSVYLCNKCHPLAEKNRLELLFVVLWNRQEEMLDLLREAGPRIADFV